MRRMNCWNAKLFHLGKNSGERKKTIVNLYSSQRDLWK